MFGYFKRIDPPINHNKRCSTFVLFHKHVQPEAVNDCCDWEFGDWASPRKHVSTTVVLNWWFGFVLWIPGIPLWKGLLLRSIPRIPNYQFTISWLYPKQSNIENHPSRPNGQLSMKGRQWRIYYIFQFLPSSTRLFAIKVWRCQG